MLLRKNIQKIISISTIVVSLVWVNAIVLAQTTPPIPTETQVNEPIFNCTDIVAGGDCTVDVDSDGISDLKCKNNTTGGGKANMSCQSLKVTSIGGSQFIESPGIAKYIASTYRYAVALTSVLATVMIIMAGVLWITSGGNMERISRAKQMIVRSVTGLVIALGSYTLLFAINPDLVSFRSLQVMRVEKMLTDIHSDFNVPEIEGVSASELKDLVSLSGISNVTIKPGVYGYVTEATRDAFVKAMDQFREYNSGGVIISDATRTSLQQYSYLTNKCGCLPVELLQTALKDGKDVNGNSTGGAVTKVTWDGKDNTGKWQSYCKENLNTSCDVAWKGLVYEDGTFKYPPITHLGGTALDMSAAKTMSAQACGNVAFISDTNAQLSKGVPKSTQTPGGDWCIPKEHQKLIRAMNDQGFCVGIKQNMNLREPWHFELVQPGKNSQFCVHENNANNPTDENMKKLYYFMNPTKN